LPLRIQTGHYARNNVPSEQRYCLCCNYIVNIEDEFHVVFICPCYTAIINKYIPHYYINRHLCVIGVPFCLDDVIKGYNNNKLYDFGISI